MATPDHYSGDPYQEISSVGRLIHALGPEVSVVPINGGSTVLVEAFFEYLGNRYCQRVIDYPSFDLRLFNCCFQRTTSSVFGNWDGIAVTEFILNRLKGSETRDLMSSLPALEKAIRTDDLGMPHLVDIVAKIIGV